MFTGGGNRRIGLPLPPALPQHHEVEDPAADGRRLQVRPDALNRRLRQRRGSGCRRLGSSQRQRRRALKKFLAGKLRNVFI